MYNKLIELNKNFSDTQHEHEQRIHDEIVVDAYGDEEVITSWYYYLEEALRFPFTAMVQTHRDGNTFISHQVKFVQMAPFFRCGYWQMWGVGVLSILHNVPLYFSLSDIQKIEPDPQRFEALTDWLYWIRDHPNEIIALNK